MRALPEFRPPTQRAGVITLIALTAIMASNSSAEAQCVANVRDELAALESYANLVIKDTFTGAAAAPVAKPASTQGAKDGKADADAAKDPAPAQAKPLAKRDDFLKALKDQSRYSIALNDAGAARQCLEGLR